MFTLQACIIAFTSEFIPKLVYQYAYAPTNTQHGYVEFSLSKFDTTNSTVPYDAEIGNVTICR